MGKGPYAISELTGSGINDSMNHGAMALRFPDRMQLDLEFLNNILC
jgi:hypothetical protein